MLEVKRNGQTKWSLVWNGASVLDADAVCLDVGDQTEVAPDNASEWRSRNGTDALGNYIAHEQSLNWSVGLCAQSSIRLYDNDLAVAAVSIHNNSSVPVRLHGAAVLNALSVIPSQGTAILTNDWERLNNLKILHDAVESEPIFSAWHMGISNKAASSGLAVGMLSARIMFTNMNVNRDAQTGNLRLAVYGDTRSGADGVLLEPDETIHLDPIVLALNANPCAALEQYATAVSKYNEIRMDKSAACGWLDWYCYYGDISEEKTLANLEVIDKKLKGYGIEQIQIDDGWQNHREFTFYEPLNLRGTKCHGAPWVPNEHFPRGMKALAEDIHRRGYKAGLWIRPFSIMNFAEEYKAELPWVIKYGPDEEMSDRAHVDLSHPDGRAWLAELFRKIAVDWGFDYIKFDFVSYDVFKEQSFAYPRERLSPMRIKNPKMTSAQAFHEALKACRNAVPDSTFLLGCNCLHGSSVGAVNGQRTSGDIFAGLWSHTRNMLQANAYRYFLNGRYWQNDPDVVQVCELLTMDQAISWASFVGISGTMLMLGDSLPDLPDERLDILKKILPPFVNNEARPLRLFEEAYPSVWHLPIEKPFGRWDIAAVFNWSDEPATIEFDRSELGLNANADYLVFDFWKGAFLGLLGKQHKVKLEPCACQVLSLRPLRETPQVLSTQYHISQGGRELENEQWDAKKKQLAIQTAGVPESAFKLFLHVPEGYSAPSVTINGETCRKISKSGNVMNIEYSVASSGNDIVEVNFQ